MKKILGLLFSGIFILQISANDIQIENVSIVDNDYDAGYAIIEFDLNWQNSWRVASGQMNWDAAWIFVKYKVQGTDEWVPGYLANAGHSTGAGTAATIDLALVDDGSAYNAATNPVLGAYFYRSGNALPAEFSITGAQIRWHYDEDGLSPFDIVDIKVFGVEMVYVPDGEFYVGSGGEESGSFTDGDWSSGATIPFLIDDTWDGSFASSAGSLWGTSSAGNNTIGGAGSVDADFPTGYDGFYCMKYEVSQQQYVDFLNTLTYDQQDLRINVSPDAAVGTYAHNQFRHGIKIETSGTDNTDPAVFETDNPYVACNFLSWMDAAAFADWAGLRPMTELEFEKIARGTSGTGSANTAVAEEYAWGSISITGVTALNNSGLINETSNTVGANAQYNQTSELAVLGPVRVGLFSTATSDREEAGGAYYGVMDLSGNLRERVVSVGNATGRGFSGIHGNGVLSTNGNADVTDWPGLSSGEVTAATGSGFRGGDWFDGDETLKVSDRSVASSTDDTRNRVYGFRAVRTVP